MSRLSRPDRAQTLPDVALGLAIFIVAVLFVMVMVPQMLLPYDGHDGPIVADRLTGELAHDRLVEQQPSSQLNETATTSFFAGGEASVRELSILPAWYSVNVTIRDAPATAPNSTILCHSQTGPWIDDCDQGGDPFALGAQPPTDNAAVSTGRVTLSTHHRTVLLEVTVW